jgi:hypothetical protein
MARCELASECWFYARELDPRSPEFGLLQKYCHGDKGGCARYRFARSFGPRCVPRGLLPNELRSIRPVTHFWQC